MSRTSVTSQPSRTAARLAAFAVFTAFAVTSHPLLAQDIAGTWQGTMQAGKEQRMVVKIAKAAAGWQGMVYSLDWNMANEGRATTQMTLQGGVLRFAVAAVDSSYEGRLAEDGATIAGTWTQSGTAYPLNLARVTGDAAWEIPKPDANMAKDADPDWDVVTVKARDPNDPSNAQSITTRGSQFVILNKTVQGMIEFGYNVHRKQIVGAPGWVETERWDVEGVPDIPGEPSLKQSRSLARKVLLERFGLKLHMETREFSVYAVTVGKGGPKLTPSAGDPNGPPLENESASAGVMTMRMTNMPMVDFAAELSYFLDRPAIDQTGLPGRFDFQWRWTVDESRAPTDGTAPPGLFTAIQEQIGLKLEPVKAPAQMLIVDSVERASAN